MSLRAQLREVPKVVLLLDAAIAALSATLLPARLIPENLDVIGPAASLLVAVGLLMTLFHAEAIRRSLRPLTAVVVVSLLVLLGVQVGFVVPVSPYGADAGTHRFLVGYSYTEEGKRWAEVLGPGSHAEYIGAVGADRIRAAWGGSFLTTAGLYAGSYMAFVLSIVLMLGAALRPARAPRPAGGAAGGRARSARSST